MTKSGGFSSGVLFIYCHRKFYIRVTITWESSELRIGDSGQPNSISIIRFDRKKYFAWEKRAYQGKKSVLQDCPFGYFQLLLSVTCSTGGAQRLNISISHTSLKEKIQKRIKQILIIMFKISKKNTHLLTLVRMYVHHRGTR